MRQTAATIVLCRSILKRYRNVTADRVLGHSDVAPSRKQDPGEKFPWHLLNESGVGHWVREAPLNVDGPTFMTGDHGEAVARLQRVLGAYGYAIAETGRYDETTRDVVTAFQRHFRQSRVDGIADASTLLTLRTLIETRPRRMK
jgi:N-acetylmuramoyl-L-alanine amidase